MRRSLFILLITLLLLRGWVGDAMATDMAAGMLKGPLQHPQAATEMVAARAHDTGAEAHFHADSVAAKTAPDCAGHASGDASHAADTHCESCSACQACHTVALSVGTHSATPDVHARLLPLHGAALFASADAALRQKPPIS